MYRTLTYVIAISLLAASATTQGGVFTDNFSTPHDYVKAGVAGTGWDGFIGLGAGETVSSLDASITRPGELYVASTNGAWNGYATDTHGPFLYKVVAGDFVASVQVTNYQTMAYNYCGLMARVAKAASAAENFISIDYFPQYGCGAIAHNIVNGTRNEDGGGDGTGGNPAHWLQVERKGNTFYLRTSQNGVTWVEYKNGTSAYSPVTRTDMAGLPVQIGIWQATYSSNPGNVAFDNFTVSGPSVKGTTAFNPVPADKATDVVRDVVLSWTPMATAVKSDVYFGTSFADVNAASQAHPGGVSASTLQDANSYDPPGVLTYGQTYYWRVDGTDANGTYLGAGSVWSFTAETFSSAIASTNITATASSNDTGRGPEQTINGSGMTGDLAGTDTTTMWNSKANAKPVWIQYAFDKPYKMHELWVWNYNSSLESVYSLGAKDVTIEYSADGTSWSTLGDFVFNQGAGTDNYTHNTTISLSGIVAKQIKITIKSGWTATATKYGLSEVRFFYIPVWPRTPNPATGSTNISPAVTLSWRAGREAASHNIYVGTDPNTVKASTTPAGTSNTASFSPSGLQLGMTYYWRVDEVNTAMTPTTWAGDVWSFTTPTYLIVDDMESYNDTTSQIFDVWADGYNTTTNGAVVGYGESGTTGTFGETVIVHGGRQSMPYAYGNNGAAISEATRTFAANQDWTAAGIKTLVLFFQGKIGNGAGQLYLKIDGVKVNYPGDSAILSSPRWKQWNIDLASVSGVNLKAVKSLTIGMSGSNKGTLYFDDLRLYAAAPAAVVPTDPGTTNLMAYFPMDGDVKDASGHSYVGTPTGVTFVDSMPGFGKAAQFNGTNSYVDLTSTFSTSLLQNLTNSTFAVWVNFTNSGDQWQRVFDFGNPGVGTANPTVYMFLTTRNGSNAPRFTIKTATTTEATVDGKAVSTGWHHIAVPIDASGASPLMAIYVDGALVTGNRPARLPKDMGATTQNWLGQSQYTGDPYFGGSIDDFRIYNRVLTAGEISYLVGDR